MRTKQHCITFILFLSQSIPFGFADETEIQGPPTLDEATNQAVIREKSRKRGDLPPAGVVEIPVEPQKEEAYEGDLDFRRSKLTRDSTEAKSDRRRVLLSTGEDKIVDLDFNLENDVKGVVAIGNPKVAAVSVVSIDGSNKQLVFKPLTSGETTVSIRDSSGEMKVIFDVVVTPNNLLRRAGEIRELLRDIEGLEIKIVGPNIVIDGEMIVAADYARLMAVITKRPYNEIVLQLAQLAPLALKALAERIQLDIGAFAPNVKTRVVNNMVFLEGSVDELGVAQKAEALALLYLPEARPGNSLSQNDPNASVIQGRKMVHNFISVVPPPPKKADRMVRIAFHFVELAKDYTRSFGFRWAPGFTGDPAIQVGRNPADNATGASAGTSFTATLSALFPKLQNAQEAGFARVLKQGETIIQSGQKGEMKELLQVPVPVTDANGNRSFNNVPVGLDVKVTPKVVGQTEDIQLAIGISNSNLVTQTTGGGATVSERSMNTTLYIKSGESAAVGGFEGGIVNTAFNKDRSGDTAFQAAQEGQTQTQPLFDLRRSKSYINTKNQFVVFVTPLIITNASDGSESLKKNFRIKVR